MTKRTNVRDRIAMQTRNLRSAAEVSLDEIKPWIPQTAPGKLAAGIAMRAKVEKLKSARLDVRKTTMASIEPNPWDKGGEYRLVESIHDVLVRPHPKLPRRFQCVENGWERLSTQLSPTDRLTVIVGEFTDYQMTSWGRASEFL